ncbi:MAG: bifunctional histidinol-phosphatase/imidazoleglycerol-phosphate dehydratase HisB [Tenacibaculum sp.]
MQKVLFIDRDGTLIREPVNQQVDSFEKLEFYPEVFLALSKITKELDFELVLVSNQDGLGTQHYPEHTFWPVHNFVINTFKGQGIVFADEYIDRSFAKDNKPTRKPGTGLLKHYFTDKYNIAKSFVIGDRLTDVELAKNLGARAVYLNNKSNLGNSELTVKAEELKPFIALETNSWNAIYEFLKLKERKAELIRHTNETQVSIQLNIDGTGESAIDTGIAFFDHMLYQIARHAKVDLNIKVKGDLQVDEHHSIEDTALALGEVFKKTLGDKLGIDRYGFCLPMDDCLAQVALDFGGRSWLVWQAEFKREMIGKMPTEMFFHFFKSFSDAAQCNLNIKAEGINEHHKIEAIFKAFAKALRAAVVRDASKMILPSTKGFL